MNLVYEIVFEGPLPTHADIMRAEYELARALCELADLKREDHLEGIRNAR